MSMVEDVMTLVHMMYRLILNQDCDQMELNSHLLLIGHVLLPYNHIEGNMYNCSMLLLPSHLTCNFLIV